MSGIIEPLSVGGMVAGSFMGIQGTLEEGRDVERIAGERAEIDVETAEAARRRSVEKAKIINERGRRLIETQKAAAAAGGTRLDVGAPLVIEAETRAAIAKDVGFVLETGREEGRFYRSRADIERRIGKMKKRQSKWDAIRMGLGSIATMGLRGQEAGWW